WAGHRDLPAIGGGVVARVERDRAGALADELEGELADALDRDPRGDRGIGGRRGAEHDEEDGGRSRGRERRGEPAPARRGAWFGGRARVVRSAEPAEPPPRPRAHGDGLGLGGGARRGRVE